MNSKLRQYFFYRNDLKMIGAKGFSLVELVIVILLLGITGAVVYSRLASPNAFSPLATQDALVSTIREAQQLSLGRDNITYEIDLVADEWLFSAKSNGSTLRTSRIAANGVTLETGSAVASGDTCSSGFDDAVAGDFELSFDGKGNLSSFTNNGATENVDALFNGVRLCINDDDALAVCVSPGGFAALGDCDD